MCFACHHMKFKKYYAKQTSETKYLPIFILQPTPAPNKINKSSTYMSLRIHSIVGELELAKRHGVGGPVVAGRRRVGVHHEAARWLGLRAARRRPLAARPAPAPPTNQRQLQKHAVLLARVQPAERHAEWWEHASVEEEGLLEWGCTSIWVAKGWAFY